ncbi:MAG: hypothetical protein KDC76_09425 [Bacteroidetes bacterium]|nr:hypothetical protein [Bacteroidota bacterium]
MGLNLGVSADYAQSAHFGWGLDINRQINSFKWPNSYLNLPETGTGPNYTITAVQSRSGWATTTLGIGPWWRFTPSASSSFSYTLYTKAGVSTVKSPSASSTLNYVNIQSGLLFNMPAQRKTAFGVTTGARFYFGVGQNLNFFINPQYVYTSAKIIYEYRDLTNAYPRGSFNAGLALESPMVEEYVTPNYFNLNVGLTYTPKAKSRKPAALVLKYPENGAVYQSGKPFKHFKWKHVNPQPGVPAMYKVVVTSLSRNPQSFTAYTSSSQVSFEEVFKGAKMDGKYTWTVTEVNSGLKATPFTLKTIQSGLDIQLQNISCVDPAFDNQGKVHYTGQVLLSNSANNTGAITIENTPFILQNLDGTSPVNATFVACPGTGTVYQPGVLNPNNSVTACISFTRPIGTSQALVEVMYHNNNAPAISMNEVSLDSLPNCVCTMCDDWKIDVTKAQVSAIASDRANTSITQDITISGSSNIKKLKAEIIYMNQDVNYPDCYTCTKHDDQMGLFSRFGNSGMITTQSSKWQNDGMGELFDENQDDYGNSFTWCASDPDGVDFSSSQRLKLLINLPGIRGLDCCTGTYTVCVRYTFTDVQCKSCSYVRCYSLKSDLKSGEVSETSEDQTPKN